VVPPALVPLHEAISDAADASYLAALVGGSEAVSAAVAMVMSGNFLIGEPIPDEGPFLFAEQ